MSVNSENKTEMQMLANACKVGCGRTRKEFGFLLVQWWISHLGHKLFPTFQQLQYLVRKLI